MLFVTLSNLFAIFPAQIVRYAFDLVKESLLLYRLSDGLSLVSQIEAYFSTMLLVLSGVLLATAVLRGFFMFLMRQTVIVVSRKIEYDLRNDLFAHFQRLPLAFYRRSNTGDLMARITEDINKVRMYLGPGLMYSVNLLTTIILVVSIMLTVNERLTWYVLLPLPVLAISVYFVNRLVLRRSTEIQEKLSDLTTMAQEMYSGIRVLKSFAAEPAVQSRFGDECEQYMHRSMRLVKINALFFPLILLLIGVSTLITLYVGGQEVMAGRLTAGNLAEFFIYVNMLTWPVASIGWVTSIIQRAAASQARINRIFAEQPEFDRNKGIDAPLEGEVVFEDVHFTYPDTGVHALKGISFHLTKGHTLGIIGKTGSGKTTIANLLLRLYEPTSGRIRVDGRPLEAWQPMRYRAQVGYIPQDDFLFSDTIANNILFGLHAEAPIQAGKLSREEREELICRTAEISDVYKDICDFPLGFETELGERGITLSGGQKQRVAIARAIAPKPKLLVLDDSFSAIDTYTEARILQNLGSVLRHSTNILISHRVSTVKNADFILVLDEGEVIESGTHEALLEQEGYYAQLYRRQQAQHARQQRKAAQYADE
jgi:ATP-binding cassette subfamily B protein